MQPELQPRMGGRGNDLFRIEEPGDGFVGTGAWWAGTGPLSTGSLGSVVTGRSAAAGGEIARKNSPSVFLKTGLVNTERKSEGQNPSGYSTTSGA